MRVHELAKELNISAKELIEKANKELNLSIKSHSITLTPRAVEDIKALYKSKEEVKAKPKAFIVKKQKPVEKVEPAVEEKPIEKVEEKAEPAVEEKPVQEPVKPVIPEVRKVKSRLEIVKAAPKATPKPVQPQVKEEKPADKKPYPASPQRNFPTHVQKRSLNDDNKRRDKEVKKPEGAKPQAQEQDSSKAPIKRHIISQEIYNKDSRGRKNVSAKDRRYSKEEEQERISLEKATLGKHKKHTQEQEKKAEITQVVIDKPMTVNELSDKTGHTPAEIIKFLMMQKILVTVNTPIDVETAKKVAENFGIEVLEEDLEAYIEEETEKEEKENFLSKFDEKLIVPRAPVVTIMGHVDHGKTTLLDSIRASKHKIVSTEVGGITQSIGAYTVFIGKKKIVFIDTPGHEAFTQMRARGAQSTDIAILVVAADDGIMPQTIEAINHAKAANVPIIVAVNKMDKEEANPDRVLQQLTEHGLTPEKWGGDTICVPVSALQKTGIDELLEYILLVAEMADLKTVEKCPATGVIIEANLDKGKGPVATMLVQNGTLKIGDSIVVGTVGGKVRALLDDSGKRVKKVGPSTPVEILGLDDVPQAGDSFEVVKNEKEMKAIVEAKQQKARSTRLEAMTAAHVKKDTISNDEIKVLNLIIKANTHGSAEAVSQAIGRVKSKEVIPKIVHVGVGDISEADLLLASASGAIILGFTVKEDANCLNSSEYSKVMIKKYDIIYQVLEDIEKTMLSLLDPEIEEVDLGRAEVRQIFTIGKTNKIAGCYVTEGKIVRGTTACIIRGGKQIFKGEINQLKRFKDDVKEVKEGFECGLSFAKFNDIQEGDIIEVSTTKEVERVSLN